MALETIFVLVAVYVIVAVFTWAHYRFGAQPYTVAERRRWYFNIFVWPVNWVVRIAVGAYRAMVWTIRKTRKVGRSMHGRMRLPEPRNS
jgi:hypothetical protein